MGLMVLLWLASGIGAMLVSQARRLDPPVDAFIWGMVLGPVALITYLVARTPKDPGRSRGQ